jgi:ribosomal protein L37AE/L43A
MRLEESKMPANYYSIRINDDIKHAFVLLKKIDGKIEESVVHLVDILDDIKAVESYLNGLYKVPRTLREFGINIARRLDELGLIDKVINVELDMKDRAAVFYLDAKSDQVFQFRDIAKSIGYPLEITKLEKFKDDPFRMYVLKFKFEQAADKGGEAEPEKKVPEIEPEKVGDEEIKFYFTCPNDGTEFEIEIKPSEGAKEELPLPTEIPGAMAGEKPGEIPKESIHLRCQLCGLEDRIDVPRVDEQAIAQIQEAASVCYESAANIIYDLQRTKDPVFVMRKYSLLPEHLEVVSSLVESVLEEDTKVYCPMCEGIALEDEEDGKLKCQSCDYKFIEGDVPTEQGKLTDYPIEPEKEAKELIGKAKGKKPPYTVSDLKVIKKLEGQCIYCDNPLAVAGGYWCTHCGYIFTEEGHAPVIEICDEGSIYDPMTGECVSHEEFGKLPQDVNK